ncbi:hypothetical protein [Sedimentibacter sp.]|uniref:hypothetical protein n=1 Tax=Sedimentibacter sp. TaxID=1960295 RepID=UPI00289759E4|nr:hypothetical protein [Sedimentibacter sp.]
MPNLNKRQKKFRKQMQELQSIKAYKNIIDDHNSFYHNTAYEQEIIKKAEAKEKLKKRIIFILIILIAGATIYKNIDLIKSKLAINSSNFEIINNNFYTKNEILQYEIGIYHNNYSKKIENINLIENNLLHINNYLNYNIDKINEQINIINSMITKFNNYIPNELEKNLHEINIKKLYLLKNKYETAILLSNNYYDNNIIISLNNSNNELNLAINNYRIELLRIFNDIKMNYKIEEDGIITFTYKDLNIN